MPACMIACPASKLVGLTVCHLGLLLLLPLSDDRNFLSVSLSNGQASFVSRKESSRSALEVKAVQLLWRL